MDRVEIVTGQTGPTSPAEEAAAQTEVPTQEGQAVEGTVQETTEQETPETESPDQGVKLQGFSDEFFKTGKLSDNSYGELEQMGFPRALVDQFIAGQQAVIAREEASVFESVGGQPAYEQMIQWAGASLSPAEVDAYNKAVGSGDQAQMMFAVKGLQARYTAQTREPNFISGSKAPPSVFRSVAEVVAAMSDPRYKTDAAYRSDVERKIAVSNVL
jgi:hypothetical protein